MDDKPTLDELITHVDVGVEWMRLGVLLKLDMKDLESIDHVKPAISDKLQQMYSKWLTSKTGATRRQLLDALRVLNLNVLAEEYKEWVRVTFSKRPITRHMASSKVKSKPAPQSLDIKDLGEILSLLKNGLFDGHWEDLGLQLGLYKPTLSSIQANHPRSNSACLRECIAKWLQRADGVDSKGGANYATLAEALKEMDQKNTANYIRSGLRERQAQPEPVPTTSVGSSYIAEDDGHLSHIVKKRKLEPAIKNRKEEKEEEKEEEETPNPVPRDKVTDRKNEEQMETDFFWSSSRKIYKYEKSKEKNRGVALIINNVDFDPETKLEPRGSSNVDAKQLQDLFKDLKYDPRECPNLTAAAMKDTLTMYATGRSISETNDSFICCILSHGDERGIFGTDGEVVSIEELASSFNGRNCPKLNGKPKIFFIQACRGENTPAAVLKYPEERMVTDDGKQSRALPPDADFLFGFSTTDSTKSMRGSFTGSQYIKELCSVIKENASGLSIDDILLVVHHNVAERSFEGNYQQMPETRSTLRGKFYFK